MQHLLTQERLKELFNYNPETGLFIRLISTSYNTYTGEIAGSIQADGYVQIGINYKLYRAHRLAWLYMTGEWPVGHIDHKNRIPTDNRFCNLRDATSLENNHNKSKLPRNSLNKYLGVSKRGNTWRARITASGVQLHLGTFATEELAGEAYLKAVELYHTSV